MEGILSVTVPLFPVVSLAHTFGEIMPTEKWR